MGGKFEPAPIWPDDPNPEAPPADPTLLGFDLTCSAAPEAVNPNNSCIANPGVFWGVRVDPSGLLLEAWAAAAAAAAAAAWTRLELWILWWFKSGFEVPLLAALPIILGALLALSIMPWFPLAFFDVLCALVSLVQLMANLAFFALSRSALLLEPRVVSFLRVGSPKSLIQPILLTVLGQSSDWPSEVDVPHPNLRCCGRLLAVLALSAASALASVEANDETFPRLHSLFHWPHNGQKSVTTQW